MTDKDQETCDNTLYDENGNELTDCELHAGHKGTHKGNGYEWWD